MRAVKGVYENGVVTLVESAPLKDKQEVTVLIPDEEGEPEVLQFSGMLRDLTPQEMAAFDEALKRSAKSQRTCSFTRLQTFLNSRQICIASPSATSAASFKASDSVGCA